MSRKNRKFNVYSNGAIIATVKTEAEAKQRVAEEVASLQQSYEAGWHSTLPAGWNVCYR